MSALSEDAQAVVRAARARRIASKDVRDRVRAAVSARLEAGDAAPDALRDDPRFRGGGVQGAALHGRASLAIKLMIAGVVVIGGGLGLLATRVRRERAPAAIQTVAPGANQPTTSSAARRDFGGRTAARVVAGGSPSPAPPVTPGATQSAEVADPQTPRPSLRPARKTPARTSEEHDLPVSARRDATPPELELEIRTLQQAQAALQQGEPSRALALLDEHAASFPRGLLVEEGIALRVLALCDLGQTKEAREVAERFLRERPQSPSAQRVRKSCAGP